MKNDDVLDKLEEDIRVIKNKYDQYFSGILKMPPMTERRNIEVFIHELSRLRIRDNSRRFRFNQLLTRYNQYREMWGRRMREREEGPMEFKKRQAALGVDGDTAPPLHGAEPPAAPPPRTSAAQRAVTSNGSDPYVKVAPGTDGEDIRRLYEQMQNEHVRLGKQTSVTFEQLRAMVQKQSEIVRAQYKVSTVAFRVETVDGKVKLKAKPLQE